MFTIPEEMSIEDRRTYLHGYDKLVGMFGADKVEALLMDFPLKKLLEIRHEDASSHNPPRPSQGETYLGIEPNYVTDSKYINGKEYSRTDRLNCHHYLTVNTLQHVATPVYILKPAMLWRWPWLSEFGLNVFHKMDEFYVKVGEGILSSLYVPFEAMTKGDFNLVIKRMEDYFRRYTKGDIGWDDFKDLPETIKFMEAFNAHN